MIKFLKIRDVKSPERGTDESAGIDLYIPNDFQETELLPTQRILIPSGLKLFVPRGYAFVLFNKSGISTKLGLDILACVVDSDYRGETHISLVNTGDFPVSLTPKMKIAQGLLLNINLCDIKEAVSEDDLWGEYTITVRGTGGFGSTNVA